MHCRLTLKPDIHLFFTVVNRNNDINRKLELCKTKLSCQRKW